ncbi:MAG: hypothetical protein ACFE0Q_15355 [Anaerolineae bacterium]
MQAIYKYVLLLISLLSIVGLVTAQDECPAEVDEAVLALNELCFEVGRNQACYGNGEIVAIPQTDAIINFTVPGDTAPIADIDTLSLSPYETDLSDWGVALLVVQANLPDTLPGQNVTMLLFGDVALSNEGGAYYFASGIGTPDCNTAPNGLLIQTPEGVGEVTLTLNGINITIGSTAYFGTLEEGELTIALLEGMLSMAVEDSTVELNAEQFTRILLDEDGIASGEFAEPEPITDDLNLPILPLELLPEAITDEETDVTNNLSTDVITPLSGNWSVEIGEINFADGCPPFLNDEQIRQSLANFGVTTSQNYDFTFEDDVVLEEIFSLSQLQSAGFTLDDSVPNRYELTFNIADAGSVVYTWEIVSETRIELTIEQTFVIPQIADCLVTTQGIYEYQG